MVSVVNERSPTLVLEIQDFLLDRQVRNLSKKTIGWYTHSLGIWRVHMASQGIIETTQVAPGHMRHFLLSLTERGHNPGGVSNIFRAVKAYLRWYEDEYAPKGWNNPHHRVKAPRVSTEPIPPISIQDIKGMVAACTSRTLVGARDKAMLLVLLDTGVRHQELTDLTVGDVDMQTGTVIVRSGKGRKPRIVFVGAKTRRAILAYLRLRKSPPAQSPLWITREGDLLTKSGIRQIIRRRAATVGIEAPGLHAFRRAFAINSLRNGMDLITLQRLMGHTSLAVIYRYLALVDDYLRAAHQHYGAVDHAL